MAWPGNSVKVLVGLRQKRRNNLNGLVLIRCSKSFTYAIRKSSASCITLVLHTVQVVDASKRPA